MFSLTHARCHTFHKASRANDWDRKEKVPGDDSSELLSVSDDRRLIYDSVLSCESSESFPPISYFNSLPQVMAGGMGANYLKCLSTLCQPLTLKLDSGPANRWLPPPPPSPPPLNQRLAFIYMATRHSHFKHLNSRAAGSSWDQHVGVSFSVVVE